MNDYLHWIGRKIIPWRKRITRKMIYSNWNIHHCFFLLNIQMKVRFSFAWLQLSEGIWFNWLFTTETVVFSTFKDGTQNRRSSFWSIWHRVTDSLKKIVDHPVELWSMELKIIYLWWVKSQWHFFFVEMNVLETLRSMASDFIQIV